MSKITVVSPSESSRETGKQITMDIEPNGDVYLNKTPSDSRKLLDIIRDYEDGEINKPEHQRDTVWTIEQKQGWVDRLFSPIQPVGVIVTYQLRNSPLKTYLNDGWQRVSTTLEFYLHPGDYGRTAEAANKIVRAISMPVQHRIYDSNEDALQDFQRLNLGTRLTPYEFYKGVLAYMPSYEIIWGTFFFRLHGMIMEHGRHLLSRESINRIKNPENREVRHKLHRDDYALFHRYSTDSKLHDYEDVSQKIPAMKYATSDRLTEKLLRSFLEEVGSTKANQLLTDLDKFIGRITREIENDWATVREVDSRYKNNDGVTITLYRWLLHAAIWKTSAKIRDKDWRNFLQKILSTSGGGSVLVDVRNPRNRVTLQASRLGSKLSKVCQVVNSEIYLGRRVPSTAGNKIKPKEGCDISHVLDFDSYGDGKVFSETMGSNRARKNGDGDTVAIDDLDDDNELEDDDL